MVGICDMPWEVLFVVISYLNNIDGLKLALSCKYLHYTLYRRLKLQRMKECHDVDSLEGCNIDYMLDNLGLHQLDQEFGLLRGTSLRNSMLQCNGFYVPTISYKVIYTMQSSQLTGRLLFANPFNTYLTVADTHYTGNVLKTSYVFKALPVSGRHKQLSKMHFSPSGNLFFITYHFKTELFLFQPFKCYNLITMYLEDDDLFQYRSEEALFTHQSFMRNTSWSIVVIFPLNYSDRRVKLYKVDLSKGPPQDPLAKLWSVQRFKIDNEVKNMHCVDSLGAFLKGKFYFLTVHSCPLRRGMRCQRVSHHLKVSVSSDDALVDVDPNAVLHSFSGRVNGIRESNGCFYVLVLNDKEQEPVHHHPADENQCRYSDSSITFNHLFVFRIFPESNTVCSLKIVSDFSCRYESYLRDSPYSGLVTYKEHIAAILDYNNLLHFSSDQWDVNPRFVACVEPKYLKIRHINHPKIKNLVVATSNPNDESPVGKFQFVVLTPMFCFAYDSVRLKLFGFPLNPGYAHESRHKPMYDFASAEPDYVVTEERRALFSESELTGRAAPR